MPVRTIELDAVSIKVLAHPLRVRMLRALQVRDRASVTSLADELGTSTADVSYHLRRLAAGGFVEQCDPPADIAPARGRPQRWWRMAVDRIHMNGFDMLSDPASREAAGFLLREVEQGRSRRFSNWFATSAEWSEAWQRASSDGDAVLVLSPDQTRALADELAAVVARYDALAPGEGARPVDVQFAVFPAETGERA